jgi:hypothetical protein
MARCNRKRFGLRASYDGIVFALILALAHPRHQY